MFINEQETEINKNMNQKKRRYFRMIINKDIFNNWKLNYYHFLLTK